MVIEVSLGVILIILAMIVVLQDKPLKAIITSGAFSASAAIAYFFMGAPDVAMAEASIGAVFTTFVYIVALKHSGKLRVGYINLPGLIKKESHGYSGVEYELLKLFAEDKAMTLVVEEISSLELQNLRDFDVVCGGLTEKSLPENLKGFSAIPYLATNILKIKEGKKFDLVRIKNMILNSEITLEDIDQSSKESTKYIFLISNESEDIEKSLADFLQNLDKGIFDNIIRRNLG